MWTTMSAESAIAQLKGRINKVKKKSNILYFLDHTMCSFLNHSFRLTLLLPSKEPCYCIIIKAEKQLMFIRICGALKSTSTRNKKD